MATAPSPGRRKPAAIPQTLETVADLLKRLGDIPAKRVRLHPTPGTATERDLIAFNDRKQGLCELVDGTLVEKAVEYEESEIAITLVWHLGNFVFPRKLGIITGSGGTIRPIPNLVRMPDVAFYARTSYPNGNRPRGPIPSISPDLAVEVLSTGNTKAEIARKLREYFEGGTRLAWIVDPKPRSVRVHTSPTESTRHEGEATLDGGGTSCRASA